MVKVELCAPRDTQVAVPLGSVLAPTLYSTYINDSPQTPGVYLALFADEACIYTSDRKVGYILRKLQRGLTSVDSWCERWNVKINEDKSQIIYFSHRQRAIVAYVTLKGRHIPFVNNVKYLKVCFDKNCMEVTYRNDRRQGPSNIY
jgi:hypothetical protein